MLDEALQEAQLTLKQIGNYKFIFIEINNLIYSPLRLDMLH